MNEKPNELTVEELKNHLELEALSTARQLESARQTVTDIFWSHC